MDDVTLSNSRRSRYAATRTTNARQVTGSQPRVLLIVKTAVNIESAMPNTSIAATD